MALRTHRAPLIVSRRSLLTSAAGTAGLGLFGIGLGIGIGGAAHAASAALSPLAQVPLLPVGAPVRSQFAAGEQLYAGYLAIAGPMANDMNDSDTADRGFLGGGWWRDPNAAYNARVQEHVSTLSWFYANSRGWNPYFGDVALRDRLDAAIGHYLSLQQADGSFPEYSRDEHSLSATAFGLGYLAKTLRNLRSSADPFLYGRRSQLNDVLKKGMNWLLNPANGSWGNGSGPTAWANQICAGLAGATVALQLTPDPAIQALLDNRMPFFAQHGQSPAGFFYEFNGMDVGYNFEVMMPEMAEIYVRNQNASIVQMAQRFATWYGYLALYEPDGAGFVNYTGASSRTEIMYHDTVMLEPDKGGFGAHLIPAVPQLAAFYTASEDRAAARAAWAPTPGPAPALAKGQPTEPRQMATAFYGDYSPSRSAKNAAIAQLPYLSSTEWAEIRRDTAAVAQDYLFVRRPKYYFGGFFGTRPTTNVSAGPGFLWHPVAGIVVHSGHGDAFCWGTVAASGPDALTSLAATYQVNGGTWGGGRTNPGAGPVVVSYKRFDGTVSTVLTLGRDEVVRAVTAPGAATEQIPLVLLPSDTVRFANGTIAAYGQNTTASTTALTITRGAATVTITWGQQAAATLSTTARTFFRDGRRRNHMLRISHGGTLTTRIAFS
jgi:hypothetical protein